MPGRGLADVVKEPVPQGVELQSQSAAQVLQILPAGSVSTLARVHDLEPVAGREQYQFRGSQDVRQRPCAAFEFVWLFSKSVIVEGKCIYFFLVTFKQ